MGYNSGFYGLKYTVAQVTGDGDKRADGDSKQQSCGMYKRQVIYK